ncbi:MAG: peptidylprolyl isomerase [Armatimonadota bacterium]
MKLWISLIVLFAALVGISVIMPDGPKGPERVELEIPHGLEENQKATMKPGRVVELHLDKGVIEFILFEEDCPNTTKRITTLVKDGFYNGLVFHRVENWVIQTGENDKAHFDGIGCEIKDGLVNAKGSVGMARAQSYNSNTTQFYILKEPSPWLDREYTVFGRVINGMDVVMNIEKGDKINKAILREANKEDLRKFNEVLSIESERKTQ